MYSITVSLRCENGLTEGHAWVAFHEVNGDVENQSLGAKWAGDQHFLLAINTRKRTPFELAKFRGSGEEGWDEI